MDKACWDKKFHQLSFLKETGVPKNKWPPQVKSKVLYYGYVILSQDISTLDSLILQGNV
jgi:hypothetical protein